MRIAFEGLASAGSQTFGAEATSPGRKIQERESPVADANNILRARTDAVSATVAASNEGSLREGPGRANCRLFATQISLKELSARYCGSYHCRHRGTHVNMPGSLNADDARRS